MTTITGKLNHTAVTEQAAVIEQANTQTAVNMASWRILNELDTVDPYILAAEIAKLRIQCRELHGQVQESQGIINYLQLKLFEATGAMQSLIEANEQLRNDIFRVQEMVNDGV